MRKKFIAPELLRCPFCGGKAQLHRDWLPVEQDYSYAVRCENCGIITNWDKKWEKVVEFWNFRHKGEGMTGEEMQTKIESLQGVVLELNKLVFNN